MRPVFHTCLCVALVGAAAVAHGAERAEGERQPLYVNVYDDAAKALAELGNLADSGAWADAVERAQKCITDHGEKLCEVEQGVYVAFAEKVQREILSWPPAGLQAYRAKGDPIAAKRYEAAVEDRDVADLSAVAHAYLASSYGLQALCALADIRAQRGELNAARQTLRRVIELAPDAKVRDSAETKLAALGRAVLDEAAGHGPFDIGLRRWSADISEADVDRGIAAGLGARGLRVPRIMVPAVTADRVFVQTTQWLCALSRKTGEMTWRYPRKPAEPTGRDRAHALLEPQVRDGRVFAFVGGEVVAVSAESGEAVWRTADLLGEEPAPGKDGKPAEPPKVLVNSLAVADGMVFACAAAMKPETEFTILALDAGTGKVVWRQKLCSQVFGGYLGRGRDPAPPAYDEGTVYVSTNLGAAAAIDAATGAVRWLVRYNAFEPSWREVVLRNDDCWENARPVLYRGMMIAAPQDSDDVIAFDMATGRQKWRQARAGMKYVAGALGGRVYVTGTRAGGIDADTGRLLWLTDRAFSGPAGRPTLAGDELLIPTEQALVRIDGKTGKVISEYRLDDSRERGNLALADGLLFSASFDRIDAYADASQSPDPAGGTVQDKLRAGRRLERLGDLAGAERLYRAALADLAKKSGAEAERGQMHAALADVELALAARFQSAADWTAARKAFQSAEENAASAQQHAQAAFGVAECLERLGQWREAVETYQRAIHGRKGGKIELHGVPVSAEQLAASRIERIVRAHGAETYAGEEAKAARLLEEARRKKDSAQLEALIADYPNSQSAAAARLELVTIDPARTAKSALTPVWRTALDTGRARPAVLDVPGEEGTVLLAVADLGNAVAWGAADQSGAVECRELATGRVVWTSEVGGFPAAAYRAGDKLIVRAGQRLVGLDIQSGRQLWAVESRAARRPDEDKDGVELAESLVDTAAGGGRVFATTAENDLFAADAEKGTEAWRVRLGGPAVPGTMTFREGKVIVFVENPGAICWLDAASGKQTGIVRIERKDNRLTDKPAIQAKSGRVALAVGDREVRNCRLEDGRVLWKAELPFAIGRVAATPDETRVVVFPDRWSFGGEVTCFDAESGGVLWRSEPVVKEPDSVFVGDVMVTRKKLLLSDSLVAQRMTDGAAVWTQPLPFRLRDSRIAEAGPLIAVTGDGAGSGAGRGYAALVRPADGAVVKSLALDADGPARVSAVSGTFLVCSSFSIQAFRMEGAESAEERLVALLDGAAPLSPLGWALAACGEYEAAADRLDEALMAENPEAATELHEQLAAVRQSWCEQRRPAYEVPAFDRAPQIDGHLREDWRQDRAAVLDKPRFIERVQSGGEPVWAWDGPNDLSAALYLGWDAKNLYLAVDVNDDVQTTHDFDAEQWGGDCLIVAIDPDGDGGYRLTGREKVFWLALTAKQKEPREEQDVGGEHSVKVKEDSSGTVYELALPWDEVGVKAPRPGTRFGLNIMVIDDDGRGRLQAVSWTPGLSQNVNRYIMTMSARPAWWGAATLKER